MVFTSGARYEKGKELSLVFAVSIMGLAFNLILMYIFVGMMLLQPMFAKVLASCIVVIWNYLARKKWIFDSAYLPVISGRLCYNDEVRPVVFAGLMK